MPNRIIVMGMSAGGFDALKELVRQLHADLAAPIFAVMHRNAGGIDAIARAISRSGPVPASFAEDGDPIRSGQIHLARPDYHMTLSSEQVHLTRTPRENGFRPAIDPLFRSAAGSFGSRVIGVLLSGLGDDGTAGLIAIKLRGGMAIVQEPSEAAFETMPRTAMKYLDVDHRLPIADIARILNSLNNKAGKSLP